MKTILIIEDQAPMRRNLALMLEMEGYRTITAGDGREGLEMVRAQAPDLVICDVMMPEMDGHEVIRALRGAPATATIPFIFLTARGDRDDVRMGMNSGADDYLVKPVGRDDLVAAVEARLARAGEIEARLQAAVASNAGGFRPDYSTHEPLIGLGLTDREAEVLLWVAQGKGNADIAEILGMSEKAVKRHMGSIFEKLAVENRYAAALAALKLLGRPRPE